MAHFKCCLIHKAWDNLGVSNSHSKKWFLPSLWQWLHSSLYYGYLWLMSPLLDCKVFKKIEYGLSNEKWMVKNISWISSPRKYSSYPPKSCSLTRSLTRTCCRLLLGEEAITFEIGLLNKEYMEVGKRKTFQAEGTWIANIII